MSTMKNITALNALLAGETLLYKGNDRLYRYNNETDNFESKGKDAAERSWAPCSVYLNDTGRGLVPYTPPVKLLAFEDRTDGEIKFVKEGLSIHLHFKDNPTRYKQVELTTDLMLKGAQ